VLAILITAAIVAFVVVQLQRTRTGEAIIGWAGAALWIAVVLLIVLALSYLFGLAAWQFRNSF
jgi:hypothetical protein